MSAPTGTATWFTPPEIAERLRVEPAKVIAWLRSGELEGVNIASRDSRRPRYRISEKALAEFLERRSAARPARAPRRRKNAVANVTRYF
jgi:excisionase family DNA binding protein